MRNTLQDRIDSFVAGIVLIALMAALGMMFLVALDDEAARQVGFNVSRVEVTR